MAHDSALGSILPIAIVGGIGYWLYSSGMLSSLFGPSAPAPTTPPSTNPPAGGTNPKPPVQTPPGPCSKSGVLAPWLQLVQKAQGSTFGDGLPGTLTIDQYCYYGDQLCTGICPQVGLTADALFPGAEDRGGPMNWSAFAGRAATAGLSAANPRNRGRRVGRNIHPGTPRKVGRMIGTNMVRRVA